MKSLTRELLRGILIGIRQNRGAIANVEFPHPSRFDAHFTEVVIWFKPLIWTSWRESTEIAQCIIHFRPKAIERSWVIDGMFLKITMESGHCTLYIGQEPHICSRMPHPHACYRRLCKGTSWIIDDMANNAGGIVQQISYYTALVQNCNFNDTYCFFTPPSMSTAPAGFPNNRRIHGPKIRNMENATESLYADLITKTGVPESAIEMHEDDSYEQWMTWEEEARYDHSRDPLDQPQTVLDALGDLVKFYIEEEQW